MRLIVLEEPNLLPGAPQPNVFDLWHNPARPTLTVGRKVGNDIVLADSSVSRVHLELQVRDDGLVVRDLNSSNGTFVNNHPITFDNPILVRPGDSLKIGSVVLGLEATVPYPASVPAEQGLNRANNFSQESPSPYRNGNNAEMPFVLRDSSELPPPEHMERVSKQRLKPAPRKRRGWQGWVYAFLALLVAAAISVGVYFLVQLVNNNNTEKLTALPSVAFPNVAIEDSVLGIIVPHPNNWQRQNIDPSRVVFSNPDSQTLALTIEKPPSRTIADPNLSPEAAIRQYLANINKNAANIRVSQEPAATKLKDGTPAWFLKVVFTANEENNSVIDYTLTALSFQCGNTLYFVSAGEEGRLYEGAVQQNLEASIANTKCR